MVREYEANGVRFRYPENWELEREENERGWTVTVQGPGTAFLMIALHADMPSLERVNDATLRALRDDYPEMEVDDCADSLAGQPAVGHEIHFFSLDFTNTCWTRALYSVQGTVLVLWQSNDLELEQVEPVLKAICASLQVDDDR